MGRKSESPNWERIDEIFHAVVDLTVDAREAFLDDACAGDDELRREVESLLVYEEPADAFLQTSALELLADTAAREGSPQPFPDVLTAVFDSDLETDGRPRLRVTTPSGTVKTVALDEGPVSFGRAETNRLPFPEDDGLSREHALVEPGDDGWTVKDLGSKNGTFVNGERLDERHLLKLGDEISASCITLSFVDEGPEDAKVSFEKPNEDGEPEFTECIRLSDVVQPDTAPPAERTTLEDKHVHALSAFARASRELTEPRPLVELFDVVLKLSLDAVGASRGVLLTLDASDRLVKRASRGGEFRISTTIRDRVLKNASSVLIREVEDELGLRDTAAFSSGRPRSLMAVPLQTADNVIGLLYVDSLGENFASDELHLLTVMASVAGIRIEREYWEQQRRFLVSENLASLTRLSAALSHELNSPLGTLRSTVDTLLLAAAKGEAAGPDEKPRLDALKAELRRALDASLERMQDVIGRIERFTNLDGAEVQAVDLKELLADVIALSGDGEDSAAAAVELDADALPPLMARPQQLSTAFSSLLSFFKSCSEDRAASVRVSVESRGNVAVIRVTGRAIDIPAGSLENLFQPQFEVAEGRVSMGNWSLFSARQLLRAQGGEMTVGRDDRAIAFTVTLPIESG